MRFFLAIIITTFFIGRAEAAYIPDVPACRALLTYQAVEQCFSALNKGITPDTTSCGVIDINSIMASTNGLRSEIIGDTWRNIGSLILHHCSYTQGTKAIFLSMEKDIFGGPTQRENAERAWKKMHCISIIKSMSDKAREFDFIRFTGEKDFGGGMMGDMRAVEHLTKLEAQGKEHEIQRLFQRYFDKRCEY